MNLNVNDRPLDSDVIVVLGGGGMERPYKGVNLLEEGYSKLNKIIVTPAYEKEHHIDYRTIYYYLGLTDNQLVLEGKATSTWTNAVYVIEIMQNNGWQSANVVTSDYHLLRTKLAFERASKGLNLQFQYIPAYSNVEGKGTTYLKNDVLRKLANAEVFKYYGYLLGLYNLIDL